MDWVRNETAIWLLEVKLETEDECRDFLSQHDARSLFPKECEFKRICKRNRHGKIIMKPRYYVMCACYLAVKYCGREILRDILPQVSLRPLWPEFSKHKLIVAAFMGESHLAERLLQLNKHERKNINYTSNILGNALFAAIVGHDSRTAQLLLDYDADSHAVETTSKGENLLCWAVRINDFEMVEVLLGAKGLDPNKCIGDGGDTLLILACRNGSCETVEALLQDPRIKPNEPNQLNTSMTPLLVAAESGQTGAVDMLLRRSGVAVNAMNMNHDTALSLAATGGYVEMFRMLIHNKRISFTVGKFGEDGFFLGVRCCEIMGILLRNFPARLNERGYKSRTALIQASMESHIDLVSMLLEYGADTFLEDDEGNIALDYAPEHEYKEIYDMLRWSRQEGR